METEIAANKNGGAVAKKRQQHQRKKVKNLEQEVELILSQDESDEEVVEDVDEAVVDEAVVTPSATQQRKSMVEVQTPRSVVLHDLMQTPRRSVRKSIKPAQEYEEIVARKCLRSAAKENMVEIVEQLEEQESAEAPPKWTPAKVGRVSQKRGKKNRRTTRSKKQLKTDKNKEEEQSVAEVDENQEKEIVEQLSEVTLNNGKEITLKDTDEEPLIDNEEEFEKKQIVEEQYMVMMVSQNACLEKNTDLEGEDLQNINIPDFGLNAIIVQETLKDNEIVEQEDMPSLILYDENDELAEEIKSTENIDKENVEEKAANDTFNASDCIMLVEAEQEPINPPTDPVDDEDNWHLISLQMSDDEDEENLENQSPAKAPRIMLTNEDELSKTLLVTPRPARETPNNRPKAYRFPTPYKSKDNSFAFNTTTTRDDTKNSNTLLSQSVCMLEPKEIVLRSIRKRSLSVCVNAAQLPKQQKVFNRVTFHSPANQTAVFEDLDLLIAKSIKKDTAESKSTRIPSANSDLNVTKRRKRSFSLDERMVVGFTTRLPIPVMKTTPNKTTTARQDLFKPAARTKLPNFAAIHQKHFNKMENVVEHVARKAERAKVLTSSGSKLRTASAHKGLAAKNQIEPTSGVVGGSDRLNKPKALKKIDLMGITMKPETIKVNTKMSNATNIHFKPLELGITMKPEAIKVHTKMTRANNIDCNPLELEFPIQLPNPRLPIVKPLPVAALPSNKKHMLPTMSSAKKVLRPAQISQSSKPAFNLSTALPSKSTVQSSLSNAATTTKDKLATRRQRHIDMFKGRTGTRIAAQSTSSDAIIRGVRSNRRFELQMKHRKNLEHN